MEIRLLIESIVNNINTQPFVVKIKNIDITVLELKEKISRILSNWPVEEQRLIFQGKILKDQTLLSTYGFSNNSKLYLVKIKPQPETKSPISQSNNQTPYSQIFQNPFMKQFMNNPEFLKAALQSNPKIQSLINKNPEMAHIFEDQEILKQAMEAYQNPNIMRQLQLNSDRAIANIESYPHGFQVLRSLYHSISEPLLDSLSNNNNIDISKISQNPSKIVSETIPNPWKTGSKGDNSHLISNFPLFTPQQPQSNNNNNNTQYTSDKPCQISTIIESHRDPRLLYSDQLDQLRNMGYDNDELNLEAIINSNGNINKAILLLNKSNNN